MGASIKEEYKNRIDNFVKDVFSGTIFPNAARDVYDAYFEVKRESSEVEFKQW